MRIKRFEASDTNTALAMVKEEMGEDAVIMSSRTIRPPKGTTGKNRVEVVAAVEYDQETVRMPDWAPSNEPASDRPSPSQSYGYHTVRKTQPEVPPAPAQSTAPSPGKKNFAEHISLEAHDLRLRFTSFLKRQYAAKNELDSRLPASKGKGKRANMPKPEAVAKWRNKVIDQLEIKPLHVGANGSPSVVALVGPTGVGKTTTAAKLAAWYSIHEQYKVALFSMDCYRIGATDQLRTYARIMRLPCEVILRKKDLAAAVKRHQDKDLIIIDTAGKSPYDPTHITELEKWFDQAGTSIDPHLVLSATAKKEDIQHIMKAYAPLNVGGLVLSKLDETRAYASLCQQVAGTELPISCLCTGQRVPEDFLLASKDFLRTLFGQGWQAATTELAAEAQGTWA